MASEFEKVIAMVSLAESFDDEFSALSAIGMSIDSIALKHNLPIDTIILAQLVIVVKEVNEQEGPLTELSGTKCTVKIVRKEQEND